MLSVYAYDPRPDGGPLILYQADADGRGLHEVGRDDSMDPAALSPSGRHRLWLSARDALLAIVDTKGVVVEVPVPAGFVNWNYWDEASWTPDGSRAIVGACSTSDCKVGPTRCSACRWRAGCRYALRPRRSMSLSGWSRRTARGSRS